MGINTHEQYKLNHRTNENGIVERRCTSCLEWKEENTDNFYMMNKSQPEKGFMAACKVCMSKDANKRQKENKEQYHKYKTDWHNKNAEKHTQQKRDWHQEHKEKRQEDYKRFVKNHPERVRQYGENRRHKDHRITIEEWKACKEYFDNKCCYCGLPLEEHWVTYGRKIILGDFHKEHFDDDGTNDLSNCLPSCGDCNSYKWKFDFDEWYNESNSRFSQERYDKIIKWIAGDYKQFIQVQKPRRQYKRKSKLA